MTELDVESKKMWCSCWPWEVVILNLQRKKNHAVLIPARESLTYEVPPTSLRFPLRTHILGPQAVLRAQDVLGLSTHGNGNGNVLGGWG